MPVFFVKIKSFGKHQILKSFLSPNSNFSYIFNGLYVKSMAYFRRFGGVMDKIGVNFGCFCSSGQNSGCFFILLFYTQKVRIIFSNSSMHCINVYAYNTFFLLKSM